MLQGRSTDKEQGPIAVDWHNRMEKLVYLLRPCLDFVSVPLADWTRLENDAVATGAQWCSVEMDRRPQRSNYRG